MKGAMAMRSIFLKHLTDQTSKSIIPHSMDSEIRKHSNISGTAVGEKMQKQETQQVTFEDLTTIYAANLVTTFMESWLCRSRINN